MRKRFFFPFLAAALLLSACGFRSGATEEQVADKAAQLRKMSEGKVVRVRNEPYVGATPVKPGKSHADHPVFRRKITFNERGSLASLASSVSAEIDIPISVQVESAETGGAIDPDPQAELNASPPGALSANRGIRVAYTGTVRGLLEALASNFGVSWEYDAEDDKIIVFSAAVKTFTIWAAPGRMSFSNKITNESKESAGGAGVAGGSSVQETGIQTAQSTQTDLSFDVWKDVETEVKSMLTRSGTVTINQAAGTITVRDTPHTLRVVERYVDDLNARLARQVALSIKVWSLEVTDATDVGVDLSLFFENPDVQVFTGASPLAFLGAGGELSAAVVNGKLKSSTSLLKGLRSLGKATQVTSGGGVVMSNQPVPVQAIRRDAYLASAERTTSEVGDTTSLVPGEVTTGFAMTVVPHIMENRRVVLQYSVNLSSLDDITEFSSGDSTVQLPKVSSRSFAQRMTLKMGQTLVLAGFEQELDDRGTSGGFLGFAKAREYKKSLLIITISTDSGEL